MLNPKTRLFLPFLVVGCIFVEILGSSFLNGDNGWASADIDYWSGNYLTIKTTLIRSWVPCLLISVTLLYFEVLGAELKDEEIEKHSLKKRWLSFFILLIISTGIFIFVTCLYYYIMEVAGLLPALKELSIPINRGHYP